MLSTHFFPPIGFEFPRQISLHLGGPDVWDSISGVVHVVLVNMAIGRPLD